MPWTKEQHAEYWKDWYPKNSASRKQRANLVHAENSKRLNEIKSSSPCTDCGRTFPAVCMDFDHVGTDKHKEVSALKSGKWEVIQREIEKCELVCANCHRIRTETRRLARVVQGERLQPA